MADKKRLEEMKVFNEFLQRLKESSTMHYQHRTTAWKEQLDKSEEKLKQIFIKQAKRIEELEEESKNLRNLKNYDNLQTVYNYYEEIKRLDRQNKHYREQLKLIRSDTFATEETEKYVSVKHLIRKRADKALGDVSNE